MPVNDSTPARQRVPAAERRDALIEAAVIEFAHGGLHGTPVDRIARHVGVAQPYVFSLFSSKRDLFVAAVGRSFELVWEALGAAADAFDSGATASEYEDVLEAMGRSYIGVLQSNRPLLMMQHHAYAACDDEVVRDAVRSRYAELVWRIGERSGAEAERVDEFVRYGMWLNVAAAMGVEDLSAGCEWMREEHRVSLAAGAGAPGEGASEGATRG